MCGGSIPRVALLLGTSRRKIDRQYAQGIPERPRKIQSNPFLLLFHGASQILFANVANIYGNRLAPDFFLIKNEFFLWSTKVNHPSSSLNKK